MTNKLSLCCQITDFLFWKCLEKPFDQIDTFCGFRISRFTKIVPGQRDWDTPISHRKNKVIDLGLSQFLVGSIEAKYPFVFKGNHCHEQTGNVSRIKNIASEKSLYTLVVRLGISFSLERYAEPVKRAGSKLDQAEDKLGKKFKTCFVPCQMAV